jgi:chromosomal replication initiator protein
MSRAATALLHRRIARLERQLVTLADRAPECPPSIARVMDAVAADFGVSRMDLVGFRRASSVNLPRQAAMLLARRLTNHSLPAIGRAIGRRDHTTVLHGIRRMEAAEQHNPALAARLAAITTRIREESRA